MMMARRTRSVETSMTTRMKKIRYFGLAPFKCPRCGSETFRYVKGQRARKCAHCSMVLITAPPGKITLYRRS